MPATQDDILAARPLIQEAIKLVGEDEFAMLVEEEAGERLRTAVARLMSTAWWETTLRSSIVNPTKYNNQLLCKLLDKAVPTQQAVKVGAEEGFRLVIETTKKD